MAKYILPVLIFMLALLVACGGATKEPSVEEPTAATSAGSAETPAELTVYKSPT